jgi:hypothetical protein
MIKSGDDRVALCISFAPSARHGLDQYVHCVFQLVIVSTHPSVYDVGIATAATDDPQLAELSSAPFRDLASHVEANYAADECERAMYESLVSALEETLEERASGTAGGLRWLS